MNKRPNKTLLFFAQICFHHKMGQDGVHVCYTLKLDECIKDEPAAKVF